MAEKVEPDYDVEMGQPEEQIDSMRRRVTRKKGRGLRGITRSNVREYEAFEQEGAAGAPQRSVEGWIIFVTNVHEEAQEDDVYEQFAPYGEIKNMSLNVDRRTGFLKGYALIEYATKKEAAEAINACSGSKLLGQEINVSWCFVKGGGNFRGKRRR
ncbi:unnamed protein product [Enterobius vermicularis]|uniref:RNA-binding protein 8A n=1 Tax=Enterobius vermicularis TaxID=51028 RepID=A0A0N4UY80_ENTVE|nr:unnamed protein product [Enterobius vermicularis]